MTHSIVGEFRRVLGGLLFVACGLSSGGGHATEASGGHLIDVPATIRWEKVGDPRSLFANDRNAVLGSLSPDGSKLAVVVRYGDPAAKTNEARLLLFSARDIFDHPAPTTIAHFSSTENAQPIAYVQWLPSSKSLIFVGTRGASSQVYEWSVGTGTPRPLTSDRAPLRWFAATPSGSFIFTARERAQPSGRNPECAESGCLVTQDRFYAEQYAEGGLPDSLYDLDRLVRTEVKSGYRSSIPVPDRVDPDLTDCAYEFDGAVAPDGQHGIAICKFRKGRAPRWWQEYTADKALHDLLRADDNATAFQLALLDYNREKISYLTSAPFLLRNLGSEASPQWIDGGRHLIIAGALEPLPGTTSQEWNVRRTHFVIEMYDPESRLASRVAMLDDNVGRITQVVWDQAAQLLSVRTNDKHGRALPTYCYVRSNSIWHRVQLPVSKNADADGIAKYNLFLKQSLTEPPALFVRSRDGRKESKLLALNSWIGRYDLGRVEAIFWTSKDRRAWRGGLYYPAGYKAAHRYPLVIQTHGDTVGEFSLFGVTTNFAARPLAAKGFFVLQLTENTKGAEGLTFWPTLQQGYESAIDYLDRRGLVDRARVGIAGWSWTGPAIGYTLTHSNYKFGAAALVNTQNWSWWWYMMMAGQDPDATNDVAPYGEGLRTWMRMSPGFGYDRIHAAMLLGTNSGLTLWDWYAALKQLHKPVEYWHFLDGQHELYRIPERLRWNELLVDWFAFWLEGKKDPDPSKNGQYERWEGLCKEQVTAANPHPICIEANSRKQSLH